MFKFLAATLALAVLSCGAASAADATWKADPSHSSAQFTAVHLAISHVTGSIPIKNATLIIPENSDVPTSVRAELDPHGIDTRVNTRDNDLRSAHFFEVDKYPNMSFQSTKITATDPKHIAIAGNLTMHGITKPATLKAQMTGKGPGMGGEPHIAYVASGTIDRTQWGMTYGSIVASNTIDIAIEIEAVKQ
ncbi:MAG: YceI family protein [Candidatus Baltobacteraceae bacterium]